MLRPVVLRHYLAVMAAKGIRANLVLAGSGVDCAAINTPGLLIDMAQCYAVIDNMVRLSGDQGIGLDVGMHADLSDLGIVGQASMTARTVRDTYRLWCQYGASLAGVLGKFEIAGEDKGVLTLNLVRHDCSRSSFRFIVEELLAMTALNMLALLGAKARTVSPIFKEVFLAYDAPSYERRYHEFFGCPVHFGQSHTGVTIAKSWFEKPLQSCDEEFNNICLRHCEDVLYRIEHDQPVSRQLHSLCLNWSGVLPKLAEAAKAMNLSERTLRRRLQQEGTSYRTIVEKFRADRAREYMRLGSMSPKQAAFLLGFNEAGAFRRAFKEWTGQTIGEYRGNQSSRRRRGEAYAH